MPRPLLLSLLLLGTVLAGCGDGPATGGDECTTDRVLCDQEGYFQDHACIEQDVRPRVYAPDTPGPDTQADPWVLGDWWQYRLVVDGQASTTRLVYYGDQDRGQHYMVGTPTRDEALEHAVFSTNPVIGRVHQALYSPHESGVHADMFHFPLCDGSQWTTTFFGTRFTMTAQHEALQIPGGTDPLGFRITGTGSGSVIEITYSPQVKWFTRIAVDRADGRDVLLELTSFGQGHKGEAFFLRGQKDEVFDLARQPDQTTIARAAGGEGPYDTVGVFLDVARTSGDGRVEVHLRDPSGESAACVGIAGSGLGGTTACPAPPLLAEVPWAEGDWRLEVVRPVLGEAGIEGEARVVSIYDRSGRV